MSHQYRLTPTEDQVAVLMKHCADSRFVWNLALEQCEHAIKVGKFADQKAWDRQLAEARKWDEDLRAGSSSVQQGALRDLRQAFKNWWSNPGHFGRPTWRSFKKGHNGFVVRDLSWKKLNRHWGEITIPKVGRVRFRLSRSVPKTCKSARVTLDSAGRWHVTFTGPQPEFERTQTGAVVGIDMGVTHTITTSDGEHLSVPEELDYRRMAKQVSRKTRGSNRHAKAKLRLAKRRAKSADRRKDWIEKTTTYLVRTYDVISIENLNVKGMMASASGTLDAPGKNVAQKRGLNRSISQQGWSMFRTRLEDKAAAATSPCEVVAVKAPGTSQRCHECGHTSPNNREIQAKFECEKCGHTANADVNASKNIKADGHRLLDVKGSQIVGPVKRQSSHSDRAA